MIFEFANAANSSPIDYVYGIVILLIILIPIIAGIFILVLCLRSIFKRIDTRYKFKHHKQIKIAIFLTILLLFILWVYFYGHGAIIPSFEYKSSD